MTLLSKQISYPEFFLEIQHGFTCLLCHDMPYLSICNWYGFNTKPNFKLQENNDGYHKAG